MKRVTTRFRSMNETRMSRAGGFLKSLSVQGAVGLLLVAAVVFSAIFAPLLAPYDPLLQDLSKRLMAPTWSGIDPGPHPFGTDSLGRDLWSRILYGGRLSVVLGGAAVVVGTIVGAVVGLVAGYFGGVWDRIIMRLTDIQLSLPSIVLALAIVAVRGADIPSLIFVLALSGWPPIARVFRAEALSLRSREYVVAAQALGSARLVTIAKHILPNSAGPGIVISTLELGKTIILAAALSFLGLGVQPPTPDWGAMLSEGRNYITTAWWICTFPGLALVVLVTGVNFLGDWLRDRLDPHVDSK